MKIPVYLACIILLAGCGGKVKTPAKDTVASQLTDTVKKGVAESPAQEERSKKEPSLLLSNLPFDFAATDTGYFNFVLGDGVYAVIKKDGNLVDTIDAYYGFQKVDKERYMYFTIQGDSTLTPEYSDPKYKKSIAANLGNYVIIDKNSFKINVDSLAPDFGWFAAPSILNSKVYYYQVKEIKDGNYLVSAAEFDPITQKTQSRYLFKDYIETDDGGYFKPAELVNGLIVFEDPQGKPYKFSKDLKLIK